MCVSGTLCLNAIIDIHILKCAAAAAVAAGVATLYTIYCQVQRAASKDKDDE